MQYEPFSMPPDWVTFFNYAGIVCGALLPMALVFKSVRQWIGRQFKKLRSQRVSKSELSGRIENLREELDRSIAEHGELVREDLSRKIEGQTDKLNEIAGSVAKLFEQGKRTEAAIGRLDLLESMRRLDADRDESVGTMFCDESGLVTFVSRSIATWLKASRSDLLGFRWLNFVETQDRKAVRAEMPLARDEHREFRMRIKAGPLGAEARPYLLTISPLPDSPPAQAWVGHLIPITAGAEPDRIV
jgi:PAS domain-containing protein